MVTSKGARLSFVIIAQGMARRFNQQQRRKVAATRATDWTHHAGQMKESTQRPRPKSSGDCMATSGGSFDRPSISAKAMIPSQEEGRFTRLRTPPLRGKGLPSGDQIKDATARSMTTRLSRSRMSGKNHNNLDGPAELGPDVKKTFAAKVAERDSALQVSCCGSRQARFCQGGSGKKGATQRNERPVQQVVVLDLLSNPL